MTHLQHARQSLAVCQELISEQMAPDYYQAVELAQAHAQIAQAEFLQRIAECAETLIEMHTGEPCDAALDDIVSQRMAELLRGAVE